MEGTVQLAVTVEDDPGRDLGEERQIGHRFFFAPEEVEPLDDARARRRRACASSSPGSATSSWATTVRRRGGRPPRAQQAARGRGRPGLRHPRHGPRLRAAGYDVAVFVDAVPRGGAPGTLYLIEPELGRAGRRAGRARHGPGHGAGARARAGRPAAAGAGGGLRAGARCSRWRTTSWRSSASRCGPRSTRRCGWWRQLLDDLVADRLGKGAGDMKKRGVAAAAVVGARHRCGRGRMQWPEITAVPRRSRTDSCLGSAAHRQM